MIDETQKLAMETINLGKQALIFVPSRASAEKTAEGISKLTEFNNFDLEKEVLKAASTPTKQCRRLSHCIKKGIAFHHAGLLQKQKDLIENEFRSGKVKIICATPTLAAGLSMPAFRVIIKSLKRYSGSWGMDWIPVLEYLQMAGRAGRPEYEKFGEAIVIAKNERDQEEIFQRYINGVPEEIYSKLAVEPVLRTYLLSLISSGIIRDHKTMLDFFSKTFWAKQFEDMPKLQSIMERMLSLLEEWGFVKVIKNEKEEEKENNQNYFVSATKLEKENNLKSNKENEKLSLQLRPTLLGKRISELYLDPLTAKHLLDCLKNYNSESTIEGKNKKNVFSLLQMISHTLEMRPLLRVKTKEQDLIQEELVKRYNYLLKEEPSAFDLEYDEFINSIKTSLFFEAWTNEHDEDFLLENYDIRPGEIRVKIEVANWLIYAAAELAKINDHKEAVRELVKLRIRVKSGAKEELLPLLKLKNIGRVRARKLFNNGIKSLGEVKNINVISLSQILGKAIAEDVKKQVGEEVKEIPKGTRKGQLSIKKF